MMNFRSLEISCLQNFLQAEISDPAERNLVGETLPHIFSGLHYQKVIVEARKCLGSMCQRAIAA